MDRARMDQFMARLRTSEGRPLDELKRSTGILKGQESLRLRHFCTSECMEPSRDLDDYGRMIGVGDVGLLQIEHELRIAVYMESDPASDRDAATKKVADAIYKMKWGPTEVPIYNLLGLFAIIIPTNREAYQKVAKYLIETMCVPVDGRDLSGTTALSHSFSTKPGFDMEYAQMLYDAGGDVNARNRYGTTVANEIVQVWQPQDRLSVERAKTALAWFLSHGGNLDIEDGDGMTPRKSVQSLSRIPQAASISKLVAAEDERRRKLGDACCVFCARLENATTLARCGRCKVARYCVPSTRGCQKLDWPRHKKLCSAKA